MKKQVKFLKGKTVFLRWQTNGWDHKAAGVVKRLYKVQFGFKMNDEMLIKIRYKNVKKVELIK